MKDRVQIWMDRSKYEALLKALEAGDATIWPEIARLERAAFRRAKQRITQGALELQP